MQYLCSAIFKTNGYEKKLGLHYVHSLDRQYNNRELRYLFIT